MGRTKLFKKHDYSNDVKCICITNGFKNKSQFHLQPPVKGSDYLLTLNLLLPRS